MKTRLLLLAAALPLAGCISFGAKPPPSLLTLEEAAMPAVGKVENSANARSIVIQVPTTPAAIAVTRVPVEETPTSLAYVKNAQWAEPPARLFARLLADTVTARTNMVVLSSVQSIADPSATLAGELRRFGLDAPIPESGREGFPPQLQVGFSGIEAFAVPPKRADRQMNMRVPIVGVQGENIGMPVREQARREGARRIMDPALVRACRHAQNDRQGHWRVSSLRHHRQLGPPVLGQRPDVRPPDQTLAVRPLQDQLSVAGDVVQVALQMAAVPGPPGDLDHHLGRPAHDTLELGPARIVIPRSTDAQHRVSEPRPSHADGWTQGFLKSGGDTEVVHASTDQ